jgi:hypothetical protein
LCGPAIGQSRHRLLGRIPVPVAIHVEIRCPVGQPPRGIPEDRRSRPATRTPAAPTGCQCRGEPHAGSEPNPDKSSSQRAGKLNTTPGSGPRDPAPASADCPGFSRSPTLISGSNPFIFVLLFVFFVSVPLGPCVMHKREAGGCRVGQIGCLEPNQ